VGAPRLRAIGGVAAVLAAGGLGAAAVWWRRNPSACPYGQRFWVEAPHPLITRRRLLRVLDPKPGERLLEIGPGTGHYSLAVAERIAPDGGRLYLVDVQGEMLEHTMRRAGEAGIENLSPAQADARWLPHPDRAFDAVYLVAVLGEVPDQEEALREIARVVRPDGRVVIGELLGDPHHVTYASLCERTAAAGLKAEGRTGTALGYFARFAPVAP
jgi:SAM-dependent methyltransferase